jgi:hypothetical protein
MPHNDTERLGAGKIGKLLFEFSVPAIIGLTVNAVYNTVDRIFSVKALNQPAGASRLRTKEINLIGKWSYVETVEKVLLDEWNKQKEIYFGSR